MVTPNPGTGRLPFNVDELVDLLIRQSGQTPQAQMPSRFDFANAAAPAPPPDTSMQGSTIDFANVQPPPIPQELLNPTPAPSPMPTPSPRPAPAPSPQRDQLAQMMGPMSQRGGDYTTSGTNPLFAGGSSAVFGKKRKK